MDAGANGSAERLRDVQRCALGMILGPNAVPAPFLADMFAQQLSDLASSMRT